MRSWMRDIAVAARGLAGTPAFTLVAVLTLALGSGAVTAIFTIADTVLLKPLPYHEPDRLVRVFGAVRSKGEERDSTSMPDYHDFQRESRTLTGLAGFVRWSFNLTSEGPAQRVWGSHVTANLFEAMEERPILGRTFVPQEDRPGENRVTVLSYGLWQSLFGGAPDVVGRKLRLDDVEHTVIGVMRPGFEFPSDAQLWVPFGLPEGMPRGLHFLRLVGRMAPGVSLDQARSEMSAIARRLELAHPDSNTGREVRLIPMREHLAGNVRPALLVLLGAAGLLLLIACANVANLLLARFYQRQGETALRRALGASRTRLFGQAFAEAVLISAAGMALGLALAAVAVRALVALQLAQENPSFLADRLHDVPRLDQIGLDGRVVAFAAGLGLLTAMIVSLLPALQLSEKSLMRVLTGVGKGGGGGGGDGLRLRGAFVVVQVALALTLVISAGLLIRSFSRLIHLDPGFRTDRVATFQLSLPLTKYREQQQVVDYCSELLRRIEALPGVVSAGLTWSPPLGGLRANTEMDVEGHPTTAGQELQAAIQPASARYFQTLGIPLVQGRFFTEQDDGQAAPVVIVNETLARRFWPNEDPIGRRVTVDASYGPSISVEGVKREVVGVVADFKGAGLARETDAEMYFPYPQVIWRMMSIVVRTQGDPLGLADSLRQEVRELDGNVAVFQLRTMDQVVSQAVAQPRFNMTLLAIFAAVSLVLATVGVYGIVSYSVSLQSREIGIRMALGARRRDVLLPVLRQGALLTLIGLLAGTLGALVLTRSLSGLLFGVEPTDPLTFTSLAAFFFLVAVLASYIPARRATRVDPLVALRSE